MVFDDLDTLVVDSNQTPISERLLHTSSWYQHLHTAHSHSNINSLLGDWLSIKGDVELEECHRLQDRHNNAGLIVIAREAHSNLPLRIAYRIEHNDVHVKRVFSNVCAFPFDDNEYMRTLPSADPLQLCQYDHQRHTTLSHANFEHFKLHRHPSVTVLEKWWERITTLDHRRAHAIYHASANITLPTDADAVSSNMFNAFFSFLRSKVKRPYTQLVDVIQDHLSPNKYLVHWYLEGDLAERRVRFEFDELVVVEDNVIIIDHVIWDRHAWQRYYEA